MARADAAWPRIDFQNSGLEALYRSTLAHFLTLYTHRHLVRLASAMPSPPAIDDLCAMSNVVQPSFPATSNEMAERLIKAGYLQQALRHDSKAIASAIARMKQD
jgi:hypothetical protein